MDNLIASLLNHVPFNGAGFAVCMCTLFIFLRLAKFKSGQALCLSIVTTLSLAGVITAVSLLPDDWTAARMMVPVSLLYGYHLYPDFLLEASNGYFYLPMGAWAYLIPAYLGKILHSPTACIVSGYAFNMFFYYTPVALLIFLRFHGLFNKVFFLLLSICLTYAIPPTRYVSTMPHVDSVGIFFGGCAIVLILISPYYQNVINRLSFIFGLFLGCSLFVKQTFVPILLLIFLTSIYIKRISAPAALKGLVTAFIILFLLLSLTESLDLFFGYALFLASGAPSVLNIYDSALIFIKSLFPEILLALGLVYLLSRVFSGNIILLGFLFLSSAPFAIFSFTKCGADMNHLIWPSYLLLLFIITCFEQLEFSGHSYTPRYVLLAAALVVLIPNLFSYFHSYCGAYLWIYNPHTIAYNYEKNFPRKVYFPFQPLSTLLANGALYHFDQGLRFENEFSKVPRNSIRRRSEINYLNHLPFPLVIAERPYGDHSYIADFYKLKKNGEIDALKGWSIYQ